MAVSEHIEIDKKGLIGTILGGLVLAAVSASASVFVTTHVLRNDLEHQSQQVTKLEGQLDQKLDTELKTMRDATARNALDLRTLEERTTGMAARQDERWEQVRERLDVIEEYLRRGTWQPPRD